MAKTKKTTDEQVNQLHDELNELLQKQGITTKSLKEGAQIPYWFDTGSYALNWIISNDFFLGVPGTRTILISGLPKKGKSFLLDVMLGSCIRMGGKAYKANIENSALYDFTQKIVGEEVAEQIILIEPKHGQVITIEKLTTLLNKLIDYQASLKPSDRKKIIFGIDSVTQLTSEKELEIINKRKDDKKDKKDMTYAVKMRELFRSVEQRLPYSDVTIVGIGQLTANITTGFAPPGTPKTVVNTKGSGFLYASSLTINMVSDKEIQAKKGIPIGIKMKMKTMANRVQYRGRECWIYFYFNRGIDRFGGLIELLCQYGVFEALIKTEHDGKVKYTKAEASVGGEYKPDVVFRYKRNNGDVVEFKYNDFVMAAKAIGEEEFLKELNAKLNGIYGQMLDESGITEEDLFTIDTNFDEENSTSEEENE